MTTLYKLGRLIFSLDHVESINLEYDPRRYDKLKPPSPDAGVDIVLSSGRGVGPFWDSEARVLRDYLTGKEVDVRPIQAKPGLMVIELVPAAEPEPEPAPAATWNGEPITVDDSASILKEMRPWPASL